MDKAGLALGNYWLKKRCLKISADDDELRAVRCPADVVVVACFILSGEEGRWLILIRVKLVDLCFLQRRAVHRKCDAVAIGVPRNVGVNI